MRIALIHSFYSSDQPSGENAVVREQLDELRRAGHVVELIAAHTDNLVSNHGYRAKTALGVATRRGIDPTGVLRQFKPDIVHVHNLFPNFGSRWLSVWSGPVVMSIHNYRLVCSNGILFRDGQHCEACIRKPSSLITPVRGRCYRNSSLATLPVAFSRRGTLRDLLQGRVMAVTTSEESDQIFRRATRGVLRSTMIPNFLRDDDDVRQGADQQGGWLAAGRLSPEKGFRELVAMWPRGAKLRIVGDGPNFAQLEREIAYSPDITLNRSLARAEFRAVLGQAKGLILPSRWYEVAPQVVVEAMRQGVPVVSFKGNTVSALLARVKAGLSYSDAESLKIALDAIRPSHGLNGRSYYQAEWTPEIWLQRMVHTYEMLIDQ